MPKYDDLGSWKIFLSLAESRSFSVTAEAFGVEPSTISRTLGTLENSLGQKLIDRSARPLELTPKGLWAVKRIAPIIRSHEKLIDEMTEDSTGLEGPLPLVSRHDTSFRCSPAFPNTIRISRSKSRLAWVPLI